MAMVIGILVALIVYGGVLALISKYGAKKAAGTTEGFFVGGRDVPAIILLGTMLMTLWQAGSAYGWPGSAYRNGVGFMSAATGTYFMCFMSPCIMYPLWLLGKRYKWITPTDIISQRYNSRPLSLYVAVVSIIFMIPFISAQIIAVSNSMDVTTQKIFPYALIVGIMLVFIFGHIIGGGATNVVAADTFAGFVGMGVFALFTYFLVKNVANPIGGVEAITAQLVENSPHLLRHSGNYGAWYNTLGITLSAGAGVIVWPHIIQRAFMGRSTKAFMVQAMAMPPLICIMYSMYMFIGLWAGRAAYPGLSAGESDSLVPMLALQYAPVALGALMVVAVFAFGLSTADSQVMTISSFLEKDIYRETSERINHKRVYMWLTLMMVGVLAIVAFRPALLVNYAFMFSSPGFVQMGPAILGGIFWSRATKAGAFVGTTAGLIAVLVSLFIYNPVPSMNPVNWGLLFNIPLFIIVSKLTTGYDKGAQEIPLWLKEQFKERNNTEFKVLIVLVIIVFMQDNLTAYLPNPILFGWVPLQWFNHWIVAIECSILGYFFCKNRFGPLKSEK